MVAEQGRTIAAQQRRSQALTRVFTWSADFTGSTDRAWEHAESEPATFSDGVRLPYGVGVRERQRERGERESWREKRLHSPFDMHAAIH